jgi:ankyrin repeat protein
VSAPLTDDEIRFLLGVLDLAREGDAARLGELLDAGVPVNLTNAAGDSLLMLAAYHQQLSVVQLLLARGADVERVNDRGQTALGAAVFRRCAPVVHALLAAGADPDTGPQSARDVAAFFGLDEMTRLLDTRKDSHASSPQA